MAERPSRSHPPYRPDIDGLRAIAVLTVVGFHAFPATVRGGFVGVDVFFVISGFLISSIIMRGLEARSFSLGGFYARRIKRIFPALGLVLLACMVGGYVLFFPDELRALGKHVFAGAMFVANLALLREGNGGYFGAHVDMKPLLHLWSLGIEEQFYFVWPLTLALIYRHSKAGGRQAALAMIAAASFALNAWMVGRDPYATFYLPFTRFWELVMGAMLAERTRAGAAAARKSELAGAVGLALIGVAVIVVDNGKPFPGWWALLPATGALLVIAAGPDAWVNRRILSARPMVWVGLISYPLYLWHWPLLSFARIIDNGEPSIGVIWGLIAAAVALAFFSYRLVEIGIRASASRLAVPAALLVAVFTIGATGAAAYFRLLGGRLESRHAYAAEVMEALGDWTYPYGDNYGRQSGFQAHDENPGRDKVVLLVGDSNLEQYYSRLRALADAEPATAPTLRFATYGGCAPLRIGVRFGLPCERFLDYALGLAADPRTTTVVFGAYWEAYLGPTCADPERTLAALTETVRGLRAAGKKVFVVLSNPKSPAYHPRLMMSRFSGEPRREPVSRAEFLTSAGPFVSRVADAARRGGARLLDPLDILCDDRMCPTVDADGRPLYRDDAHMRSTVAERRASFIDAVLR